VTKIKGFKKVFGVVLIGNDNNKSRLISSEAGYEAMGILLQNE